MAQKNDYELKYNKCQLSRKISIPMKYIGPNIKNLIDVKLSDELEGKCCIEGFVIPGSVNSTSYSSGLLESSDIIFQVILDCNIVCPVEGMLIACEVENITKAGIKAKIPGDLSPLVIFIARDHNFMETKFNNLVEKDNIVVKVIGQRYELNDTYISVIAEIKEKVQPVNEETKKIVKKKTLKSNAKPKLKLKE